jgi:hypothetical protein
MPKLTKKIEHNKYIKQDLVNIFYYDGLNNRNNYGNTEEINKITGHEIKDDTINENLAALLEKKSVIIPVKTINNDKT